MSPTPEDRAERDARSPMETEVSALHPLQLYLDRETLIDAVEASIRAVRANSKWKARDLMGKLYVKSILQQRVEFLEWLNRDIKDPVVLVCIYPADEMDVIGTEDQATTADTGQVTDFDLLMRDDENDHLPF